MANLSKLRVDNALYDIKDSQARGDISTLLAAVTALQNRCQALENAVLNRAPVVELTDYTDGSYLPLGGVYLYGGLPVSHMRYAQDGPQSGYILFCTSHADGSEDTGVRYLHFSTDNLHDFYFEAEYDEDTVPDWVKKMFGHN